MRTMRASSTSTGPRTSRSGGSASSPKRGPRKIRRPGWRRSPATRAMPDFPGCERGASRGAWRYRGAAVRLAGCPWAPPSARQDMSSDRPWLDRLRESSAALQSVLGALLEAERHFAPPASPLERLRQITTSPEWAWLQPLYRLIADVDHALAYADDLPASESAAIGAHARELLTGGGAPAEQPFLEHYRALLQTDPGVAMAHAAALRALQALPGAQRRGMR